MTAPLNKAQERDALDTAIMSQWALIGLRFRKHRVAVASAYALGILYLVAALAEFFAPYGRNHWDLRYIYAPPQMPHISIRNGLHVNGLIRHVNPVTQQVHYEEREDAPVPLGFFVQGQPYRLWGLIPCSRRFFGVDETRWQAAARRHVTADTGTPAPEVAPCFYLLGADKYGRDLFSRIVYGSRISLSVGLIAIVVTFLFGVTIGGVSGYVGGKLDTLVQRLIEILNALPQLPLWMALAAAVPADWSPLRTYFAITILLAFLGWTGLARVVRGKLLSLREEDYAVAARLLGASHARIIGRHLLPGFTSHIIVDLTLRVPVMILGETSLSFLGLGLREPVVSWGVLLQDCMNIQVMADYPWMLTPAVFIILLVLGFNFLGDGLRDAADPYSTRA